MPRKIKLRTAGRGVGDLHAGELGQLENELNPTGDRDVSTWLFDYVKCRASNFGGAFERAGRRGRRRGLGLY